MRNEHINLSMIVRRERLFFRFSRLILFLVCITAEAIDGREYQC
jgi:hypothetical protein